MPERLRALPVSFFLRRSIGMFKHLTEPKFPINAEPRNQCDVCNERFII